MPLITLDNACLAFGDVPLLDHTALVVEPGERLALIGRNGTGKSSLLKILAGDAALDDGTFWRQPGMKLAYVSQEPRFEPGARVFDAIAQGLGELAQLLIDYHDVAEAMAHGDETVFDRMSELQDALEHHQAWRFEQRIEQALERLALPGDAHVESLSGGMLKRVALARALVAEPDMLLLDEPTNHLDLDGIAWLESLLNDFRGASLVITHDRRFLDSFASRILELDRGQLRSYPGRYAEYVARKADELSAEALESARADKLLAQEEVWIRKGVEARRTRAQFRVKRLDELRARREARRDQMGRARIEVDRGEASGQLVAELEDVSKCFGDKVVVRNFSARIVRGDKVGFIGPNGAGKTTLLKLILGQLEADSGVVRNGTRIEVAYFDQFRSQLDDSATLAEVISPGSDFVEIAGKRTHVIGYLGDFLFPPQRARAKVESLSGGERNRLLLARLFARPANVLVLDEPTNDLDMETLDLLEQLLQDYDGTVLLVSHDRAFLDAVVTQTVAYEGDGRWREYIGGYTDWVAQRATVQAAASAAAKVASAPAVKGDKPVAAAAKSKLSFKEQKELDGLPDLIATLEAEQATLTGRLSAGAGGDAGKVSARLGELATLIDQAMVRWEALEARR
ncbi:MAG: ATP-binding cassette domain-containing protein [Methyloversatilis sp.]|uniref:ATP-binding cassette domain-containing protein n=1 Tax=Methyloversatilis sp. TaxID=2569862 RepID=UPI002735213E|nr:ATP-binding cassette domain-containing protein [Methyloversatilis sp.]MDP3872367.1 ATP-binding cassette domain-containing protein [Methyloversatilis sp.]